MKRIFLNIKREYGIDIMNDKQYYPVMATLNNIDFPPASNKNLVDIVDVSIQNFGDIPTSFFRRGVTIFKTAFYWIQLAKNIPCLGIACTSLLRSSND